MANRVVDIVYRLRDLFSGQIAKITGGYRKLGDEADRAASRTERAFKNTAGRLEATAGVIGRIAGVLGVSLGIQKTTRAFSEFVDQADRLGKLASSIGTTTEELSILQRAADLSGVSAGQLESSLSKLQKSTSEAAQGFGEAGRAFEQLGLDAAQLNDLPLEQKLRLIADGINNLGNQADRVQIASAIFGRGGGVEFLRVLQDGAAGFDKLAENAKRTARIIDTETSKAAQDFNDSLTVLSGSFDRVFTKVASPVVKELAEFFENIGQSADPLKNLNAELTLTEIELRRLNNAPTPFRDQTAITRAETNILRLRREMSELRQQEIETKEAQEERNRVTQREAAQASLAEAAIKSQVDAFEEARESVKQSLAQETADLRAAKAEQSSIAREFADLVKSISGEQKEANLIDAAYLQRQARAALDRGEIDMALEKAREAGDMLRALKAEGKSGIEFSYLAKELERIANAASEQRVGKELFDVQGAQSSIDVIKAKLAELQNTEIKVRITPVGPNGEADLASAIETAAAKRGYK